MSIEDDLLFCLWTSKTKPLKDMFELLHDLINEGNLECTDKGIRLINVNSNGTLVVHLKLEANSFEKYYCKKPLVLGLNMDEIYKIIKLVENNETLKIYVSKHDENHLSIERFNKEEKIVHTKSLPLYDIEVIDKKFPILVYDNVIIMPSQRFKKLCQEFYQFSDNIEIVSNNNTLFFNSKGDRERICQKTSICESDEGIIFEKKNSTQQIFSGLFNLKYLAKFSKCANLCTNVCLNLQNDCPLILECKMDDFGLIRLCVAEIEPDV